MKQELEINQTNELFDLETLITDGADAIIPITIEFPDGKCAAAKIKPISTAQFRSLYIQDKAALIVNLLEIGLLNKNGEHLSRDLIEAMPLGVSARISEQICVVSGLELKPEDKVTASDLTDKAELFP